MENKLYAEKDFERAYASTHRAIAEDGANAVLTQIERHVSMGLKKLVHLCTS